MVYIKKQRKIANLLIGLVLITAVIGVIFASVLRLFYGTEITDEIFAISEAALVDQGATPFVNNWTQTPGFSVFNVWIIWIYRMIFRSYEGIFLGSRFFFMGSNILLAILIAITLYRTGMDKVYCASAFIVVTPFYFLIPNLTYNSISMLLLRLIGIALLWGLHYTESHPNLGWCAGVLCALDIYCHPSDVFAIIVITVMIFRITLKKNKVWLKFCCGGLITAIVVTLWMLIRGNGAYKLLYGLKSVLEYNPYFELGHSEFSESMQSIFEFLKEILFCYVLLEVFFSLRFWTRFKMSPWVGRMLFLMIGIVGILFRYSGLDLLCKLGGLFGIYLIGRARSLINDNRSKYIYIFTVIPILVATIAIGFFSYGTIITRLVFAVSLAYAIIVDISIWNVSEGHKKGIALGIAVLIAVCILKADYTYIYRDGQIEELQYKVDSGIYKGVYTTKERAETLPLIETYLKTFLTKNDKVLFMEVVPFAYLMTDAQACTPSTWDVSLYSYGFNDDSMYQRYFETVDEVPDYIIYIDTGRDNHLSVEEDSYNFTKYVKSKYIQKNDLIIGSMRVITYQRR